MSLKYFGTDGIRGTYGSDPITETFAQTIARGIVSYLKLSNENESDNLSIVIGRDTRFSGPKLSKAFADLFQQAGITVIDLGTIPTPQVAFAVAHLRATLGLSVTASHNPVNDNGFKLFKADGTKFSPEEESILEHHIEHPNQFALSPQPASGEKGNISGESVTQAYFKKLRSLFPSLNLSGIRIFLDTANGATCFTTPQFLKQLGAEVLTIGDQPDGQNINAGVGSEYPEMLCQQVKATSSDYGIAHDGDGDRVVIVDASGSLLSGEHFMGIIARYSPTIACSTQRPLVTTSMSNYALNAYLEAVNVKTIRTDVGDRNVAYQMFSRNCLFGGENSGHFICADVLKTGDGLVAVLKLFEAIESSGKPLSDLVAEMHLYPSKLLNLKIRQKRPLESLLTLQQAIVESEQQIAGKGRVLTRYSGTENKLRILVECASSRLLDSLISKLDYAARMDLEVI